MPRMIRSLVKTVAALAGALMLAGCGQAPVRTLPATAHFSIKSQLPPRRDAELARRFEAAYAGVAGMFDHAGPAPWLGRCDVYCFRSRRLFERTVAHVGKVAAHESSSAYQIATGAQTAVVLHSPRWFGRGGLHASFAHELAHAFLAYYAGTGPLPVWVHEGLAQHFEFRQPEGEAKAAWQRDLAAWLTAEEKTAALLDALDAKAIAEDDEVGYAMAWLLVEALLARAPGSLRKFVRALKGGKAPEEALEEVYGLSAAELVSRCAQ